MKKIKRYIGILTMSILVLSAGVILGSRLENAKQEKIKGSLYNSTKIAIVNLDEGVTYQNEQKNYAKELIDNYSENYILTGLADAKTGITDGRYAAYVIIPSDFSTNFVSVNAIPNKSLLKYEISGELSQSATDTAWQNVMQLKESINDDAGYVYISSILGEFHNGQNNAIKVLSNDSKDKEVIMAISNLDLVSTLDLKEVESLQNNIEALDINPDIEKNKEIISAIDTAYKEYLTESLDQFTSLQDASTKLNEDNENVNTAANNIKNLLNVDGTKNYGVDNTTGLLDTYNTGLLTQVDGLLGDIDSETNNKSTATQSYITDRTSEFNTIVEQLQMSHETLTTSQWDTFKTELQVLFDSIFNNVDIDWKKYPTIKSLLDEQKTEESLKNATNYIDKVIINQFVNIDFTIPDLDYDTLIENITNEVSTDKKLQKSLEVYYQSIKKPDEDINGGVDPIVDDVPDDKEEDSNTPVATYTLKEYLESNKDIFNTLPEIDSTAITDQLEVDLKRAMKTDINAVITNHDNTLKSKIDALIENQKTTNIKDAVQKQIDHYKEALPEVPIFKTDTLRSLIKDIAPIEVTNIQSMIDEDLQDLSKEQTKNKEELLTSLSNHETLNTLFQESILSYDPLENIKSYEIQGFVSDYGMNNTETQYKIENKNREYTTFVSDVYSHANEQVQSMKEDISKYQQQSDEMVTNGLENAKKVKSETSNSNFELMSSLINKLSYTRNGTVANSSVYDFVMASTDIEGQKADNKISKESFDYSLLFIRLSVGAIGVFGIISICTKIKEKSKKESSK